MPVSFGFSAHWINRLDLLLLGFDVIKSRREGLLLVLSCSHGSWCSCCAPPEMMGSRLEEAGVAGTCEGTFGGSRAGLGGGSLTHRFLFPVTKTKSLLRVRGRSSCVEREGEGGGRAVTWPPSRIFLLREAAHRAPSVWAQTLLHAPPVWKDLDAYSSVHTRSHRPITVLKNFG